MKHGQVYKRSSNLVNFPPHTKEIADELRKELIEVYKPVIEILTKAKRAGFEVAVTTGADGFQQVHVMSIQISKVF